MREIDRAGLPGMKEYAMWYVKDDYHMAVVIAAKDEPEAYTRFHTLGFSGWVYTDELDDKMIPIKRYFSGNQVIELRTNQNL